MNEVRTRSIPTAAALILLGHEPIGVLLDPIAAPTVQFPASAAADLRKFLAAKNRAEELIRSSAWR